MSSGTSHSMLRDFLKFYKKMKVLKNYDKFQVLHKNRDEQLKHFQSQFHVQHHVFWVRVFFLYFLGN